MEITLIAAISWEIWKFRNRAWFENKLISLPNDLICYACVFLNFWAGLHRDGEAQYVRNGAGILQVLTSLLYIKLTKL
jgi:hypothetical protein